MSAIEWRRETRRVLLPVLVLAPFPVTDLTGSSVSGVATRVAEALVLARLGKRPLISAQGQGQVERFAFRVGFRPDAKAGGPPVFPFVFDEVIGIELTNAFEFEALIGMDILSQCDFDMRRDGWCRLAFG
jgi:hypothetical protein